MEFLSTDHLTTVMLYLHIRQEHILHRNQVLAVRQAVVVAEEEAHPAEVEEVAEATASNDMQKLQKPKLLTGCGKLMQTRKHIIFYNKTEKPFCVFSVFF